MRAWKNGRQNDVVFATFPMFSHIIETSIFATPSGTLGLSLFLCIVGMLIVAAGVSVPFDYSTAT